MSCLYIIYIYLYDNATDCTGSRCRQMSQLYKIWYILYNPCHLFVDVVVWKPQNARHNLSYKRWFFPQPGIMKNYIFVKRSEQFSFKMWNERHKFISSWNWNNCMPHVSLISGYDHNPTTVYGTTRVNFVFDQSEPLFTFWR